MKDLRSPVLLGTNVPQHGSVSDEVRQKLKVLFNKGHSSATAQTLLKVELLLDASESYHERTDKHCFPNLPFCFEQCCELFNVDNGNIPEKNKWFKDLIKCCEEYNNDTHDGKASVFLKSGHIVVAVCTPVMQRTHFLVEQARDIMFFHTVIHKQKPNTIIYCLTTTSAVGDIPLGCIITDTEKKDVLMAGLTAYHTVLPSEAFFHQGYPNLIITSEDLKDSLTKAFPNSIILTGQSYVLKAVWKWLWDAKNAIDPFDRQELFQAFKAAMFASSEDELREKFQKTIIKRLTKLQKYDNFVNYLTVLWNKREEWASTFRNLVLPFTFHTDSNVGIIQRILSDYIMHQTESFNIPQMFDYMVVQYESFIQKCLANCTNKQFILSLLKAVLPSKGGIDTVLILELQKLLYQVPSEMDSFTTFTVDLDIGICSCEDGSNGMVCRHLAAVIEKFKLGESAYLMSEETHEGQENDFLQQHVKIAVMPTTTNAATDLLPFEVLSATANEVTDCLTPFIPDITSDKTDLSPSLLPVASTNESQSTFQPGFSAIAIKAKEHQHVNEHEMSEAEKLAKQLYSKVNFCIKKNPKMFVPAMRKLHKHLEYINSKDAAFSTVMQEFGRRKVFQHRKRKPGYHANQLVTHTLPPHFVLSSLHESETAAMSTAPVSQSSCPLNSYIGLTSNEPVKAPLTVSLETSNIESTSLGSTTIDPVQSVCMPIASVTLSSTTATMNYVLSGAPATMAEPFTVTLPIFLSVSSEGNAVTTSTGGTTSSDMLPATNINSSTFVDNVITKN